MNGVNFSHGFCRRKVVGQQQSTADNTKRYFFKKGEGWFLWSGRFPYIPSPLHLPLPRRPKPNQAQQRKKIAKSMSLLKFTLILADILLLTVDILHNMNRITPPQYTDPCLQIWRITIKSFLFYEGTFTHKYIYICICIESKIGRNTLMVLAEVVVRKIQSHTTVQ